MKYIEIFNILAKYYNRDPKNYLLHQVEIDYKNLVKKYSKAYLAGSYWYVGDSYISYIKNKKFETKFFTPIVAYALDQYSKISNESNQLLP